MGRKEKRKIYRKGTIDNVWSSDDQYGHPYSPHSISADNLWIGMTKEIYSIEHFMVCLTAKVKIEKERSQVAMKPIKTSVIFQS